MSRLTQFRSQVDDFMAHHPQSPLTPDQRVDFDGLAYFDENLDLAFQVTVDRFGADEPLIEMQTNTGDVRPHRRWGRFSFTVAGQEASLVIYSDPTGRDFFLPFRDATSGNETYGAGRYMDDHRPALIRVSDTEFEIDFNYAYNPYCAYNANYSCPLPPRENWLAVPIRAGEKEFE